MPDGNAAIVWLTAVLAAATVALAVGTFILAKSTVSYTHMLSQPNVTAFFEASGNWINLVVQNTGSDAATATAFHIDLSPEELSEIYGPNKHGPRYIVFETLDFFQHVGRLAPGQIIRHRWLHRWKALQEGKPRPCAFSITYADRWGGTHLVSVPFNLGMFGTWDGTHVMEPPPLESIAESLKTIAEQGG